MKSLVENFVKTWRSFRDDGAVETMYRLLHRLRIVSVVHSLDFFIKELNGSTAARAAEKGNPDSPWTFREVSAHEFECLRYAEGLQPIEWMRDQFDRGSRFFAAFENECVVGVDWIHLRVAELGHVKRMVELPREVAYTHSALVAPPYRNKGIGTLLKKCLLEAARRERFRFMLLAVFLNNQDAMRWHERNGFSRWGRMTYVRWHGRDFWRVYLTKTGRRYPNLLNGHRTNVRYASQTPQEVVA